MTRGGLCSGPSLGTARARARKSALNGTEQRNGEESIWDATWRWLSFQLSKGNLELGTEDGIPELEIVQSWTTRFAAAVISLLPLEQHEAEELEGYPEAAVQKVEVRRHDLEPVLG